MSLVYFVKLPNVSSFRKRTIGNHYYITYKKHRIITPCNLDIKTFSPSNFNIIKDTLGEDHMIVFEKIKHPNKFIQIIDHINKTGHNPLVGNTPFKDKPRFPDISNIYDKKEMYSIVAHRHIIHNKMRNDELNYNIFSHQFYNEQGIYGQSFPFRPCKRS